jgi:UDP-N-acetylmuramate dehydrogenase
MPFSPNLEHLIRHDEPLAPYTWLGIGGPARYFAEPTNREEFCGLVRTASESQVPIRLLGDGSNVLVREAGFDGLVIHTLAASFATLQVEENRLIAGGGAKLSHALTRAIGCGLGGLERLAGVPGTVGGAVVGNASAGGTEIGATVARVQCVEPGGSISTLDRSQIQFGHRKSDLAGKFLLEVEFELEPADPVELTKRLQKTWIVRRASRPLDSQRIAVPFIDPNDIDAATLIDQVGLKGTRRGNVSLDSTNPAYMIAHSGATSDDCLELLESVREQVSRQLGIDLQLNLVIW